jgi:protein-tyrosine phosphatase
MAEGVFRHLVSEAGLGDRFEIDSSGTDSWHVGERTHRGTRQVLAAHGIRYDHRARQVRRAELDEWDYVIAMDAENLSELKWMADSFRGEMGLLLDYAPELGIREVPDPYYNDRFDEVYALVMQGCQGLLNHIREKEGL